MTRAAEANVAAVAALSEQRRGRLVSVLLLAIVVAAAGAVSTASAQTDQHPTARPSQTSLADALTRLRDAATQGDAHAQFELGLMYETGEGVPKDDGEAA